MAKDSSDQYGKDESEKRMTAALRGARLAKPKPLASIPPKRPKTTAQKLRAMKPKK